MGYVGQTSRQIKICLNEHKSKIRLYKTKIQSDNDTEKKTFGELTVARHFYECGHNISDLRYADYQANSSEGSI